LFAVENQIIRKNPPIKWHQILLSPEFMIF